jgi:hypothetical protein
MIGIVNIKLYMIGIVNIQLLMISIVNIKLLMIGIVNIKLCCREEFPNLSGLEDKTLTNPTSIKPPFR